MKQVMPFVRSRPGGALLLVLCFSILTIWGAKPDAMPLVFVSGLAFWAFAALCWRSPYSRAISLVAVLLWAVNVITTVLCKIEYNGMPSTYMAESVLATNPDEAAGMISDHLEYLFLFLFILGAGIMTVRLISKSFSLGILRAGSVFFAFFILCLIILYGVRHRGDALQMAIRTTTKTPFYHGASFLASHAKSNKHAAGGGIEIERKVETRETGIETYILIIGESARRKNMGLYGAGRDTTPHENAEKTRMLLFTQAIAPAGSTIASVPKTLRPVDANGNLSNNYKDNIITLANRAGFQTFWLSNQEDYNPNYAVITEIMQQAGKVFWKHEKYDGSLLGQLGAIVETGGKKLIVLHFRGSHEPPGDSFPREYEKFSGGDAREDDYDNSIYYTDAVIGEIFQMLRDRKASVLYYSDHALIRKKKLWYWKYRHAGGVKEAYEIPMWIWYAPVAGKTPRLGVVDAPYSTSENYYLLKDWLGVEVEGEPALSVLHDGWKPSEIYVDGQILFSSLRRE